MGPLPITAPQFDDHEIETLRSCLASGWVTQGPMTSQFERLFASRHLLQYALATTSCTAALHLSTLALQLQPGDEVVVPAFTWVTSAHSAEYVGARAVFADVDLSTFNLDPAALEAAITPRTRAIVVVHLFGKAAPMDEIMAIARRHNLAVIEDAACAVGTTYQGRPIGAIGDLGCFSFHPRKVITTGEGGMVTTNRKDLADRVKSLRNHGATGPAFGADPSKPYTMSTFEMLGFNLRMSDIQAAVGVAQMAKLDRLLAERRRLALRYSELLEGVDRYIVPLDDPGHTYQSYVIRVRDADRERRNRIMEHLAAANIQTRPGTHAVVRLGYYVNKYQLRPEAWPNACLAEDSSITLPIFPGMTEADQALVVRELCAP
ncbi:MAG TPA: DegT/DnrJ/EryC1/StrS family aminotransferase [Nitrospira sp.]|nr:DegT/DnrJ/EryC1/StrS family aminotransferase [Nitrospira sp.]